MSETEVNEKTVVIRSISHGSRTKPSCSTAGILEGSKSVLDAKRICFHDRISSVLTLGLSFKSTRNFKVIDMWRSAGLHGTSPIAPAFEKVKNSDSHYD